ncbi:unnamed protein product [Hydatigera taeniaeformis]|uniref:PEROXIDASE_4 domain-containing protein n=1 Tax=Hydatigena taeniaeformis TaxID=6205 RepID=A0A0R3X1Y1_HYDTA|nr:unnamed protein product [Hydatigera taeniaeformis]
MLDCHASGKGARQQQIACRGLPLDNLSPTNSLGDLVKSVSPDKPAMRGTITPHLINPIWYSPNMPKREEVEAALKNKASNGKIKVEDVLASIGSLGVSTDAVDRYLKEHKDSGGMVDLAGTTKFISSL